MATIDLVEFTCFLLGWELKAAGVVVMGVSYENIRQSGVAFQRVEQNLGPRSVKLLHPTIER